MLIHNITNSMMLNHHTSRWLHLAFFIFTWFFVLGASQALAQNTPVAGDDENFTYQDIAISGNVFDNDYDLDGDELTFSIVTSTTNGIWDLQSNGEYLFTPNQYFTGIVDLVYEACDEDDMCAEATLTMYVIFLNDAPQANDDAFNAEINTTRTFNARLNDVEPDNEVMLFYMVAPPSNGTASINVNTGIVTYTPSTGYTGSDSFIYQACDPCNVCNQAVVNINVLPANASPVFAPVAIAVTEDVMYNGTLTAFASDADNDPLTYGLITNSPNGSVTILPNGDFTFNPQANFNGLTSFFCQVCDIVGQCTSVVASVTVNPINDLPTAQDDSANGIEDTQLTANVNPNDSDVEAGILTFSLIQGPAGGVLNLSTNGSYTFDPPANQSGTFTFQYEVCDNQNGCDQAQVTMEIAAVNDAPIPANINFTTTEDNVLNTIISGCTDIDSPSLNYIYTSGANNGNITIDPNGALQYIPNANWYGVEVITYEVCDNLNACATGEIEITVNYIVDAPIIIDEELNSPEDEVLTGNVGTNDNNQGEGLLNYSAVSEPSNGTLILNQNGTFTYQPDANWYGTEIIQYTGCNSGNACDGGTLTITILPVNDAPSCTSMSINLLEDESTILNLQDLFINVDDEILNLIATDAINGELTISTNDVIDYAPDNNYFGEELIEFTFCDQSNLCCTSEVSFNISPINDTPLAFDANYNALEDNILQDQLPNANDIENDDMTYAIITPPMSGNINIASDGTFTYTPNENFNGIDFITYSVCDENDACDAATASFQIESQNDVPIVISEGNICPLDIILAGNISTNDNDIESANLLYTLISSVGPGSIVISPNGTYSFTPTTIGFTFITYSACDDDNGCAEGILTIETIDNNTSPIASNVDLMSNEDETYSHSLLDNVVDNEGGELSFTLLNSSSSAAVSLSISGDLTIVPQADYHGSFELIYQVCDNGNLCSQANISIVIQPINDAPSATPLEFISYQDQMGIGSLNESITDDSDTALSFSLIDSNLPGTLTIEEDGDFNFSPQQYVIGNYTFTYSVCDEGGLCDEVTSAYYLLFLNDVPVAEDGFISTNEESDYEGNLNELVSELDQETLTFDLINAPSNGVLNLLPNGEYLYSPNAEYSGFDAFTFIACDQQGTCDEASVTIEVVFMNDLPIANDDFFMVLEDDDVSGNVTINDIELDIEIDTYSIYSQPDHGTLILNLNGTFTYTPNPNYYGLDQAVILMCDPCGACDFSLLDFEVTFINDMPVVEDESIVVYQNTSYEGSVADNDYELDIEELTYFIVNDNSQGIFQLEEDGDYIFIPGDDALGLFYLDYMACDPCGACSFGTLTIEVVPLEGGNTSPSSTNISIDACSGEDLQIDLANYIFDIQEPDESLIISYAQPSVGFVSLDGTTLNYFSNEEFVGTVTIEYQVCDNGLPSLCSTSTITIDIYQSVSPSITDLYVENVTCANGQNGSIEILEISGLGNVTVTWFNGENGNIQENLSAGNYEFTLTSDALCALPANYGIDVTEPSFGLTATADVVGITDNEDGFIELTILGGQEPYTVNWAGISGAPDGTNLNEISAVGTYYASITDANGCSLDTSFSVTGLNELERSYTFNCYPNPTQQNLTVEIMGLGGQQASIEIFDISGQLVTQLSTLVLQTNHRQQISVAHLASGYYTIAVKSNEIDLNRPFIKE